MQGKFSNNAIYQPMNNLFCIVMLLVYLIGAKAQVQPYSNLGSTSSAMHTLYNNTVAMSQGMPANSYSISYATPKQANPELVINLVGLEERDDLTDAYLKITLTTSTLTSFSVEVLCGGSSLIYLVKIMYLSIVDTYDAFYCLQVQYPTFSVVNTGTGSRVENKYSSFYSLTGGSILNNNLALNRVYPFILGFEMQTTIGNYALEVSAMITNTISFTTTVKTESDCRIQFLLGMFLFIDTSKFVSPTFYYYDTVLIIDALTSLTLRPDHFGSPGHVILGLFYFKGAGTKTTGAFVRFDLTVDTTMIKMERNSTTQKTQYTYLFFGLNGCLSTYPYFTDESRSYCVSQCSVSQTRPPPAQICLLCTSPCIKCTGLPTKCTDCETGYTLSSSETCQVTIVKPESKWYLLGLLGVVPIALLVVYLCLRKRTYVFNRKQAKAQPSIDFS